MIAILMLVMGLVIAMLLMGMIVFGTRSRDQMRAIQEDLGMSATSLQGSVRDLLEGLEESRNQQERIMQRLVNLETIVTSETWDVLEKGEKSEHIHELLKDEPSDEPHEEPSAEEKARRIAKRVR
jgi:uncharacterized membrane-anchored protein YhcB (DUF1043 family)